MEYETQDSNNWIERVKESPRTVSALIIILIVAAAIYAFSGKQAQDQAALEATAQPEETTTPQVSVEPTKTAQGTVVTKEAIVSAAKSLPEARKTETAYVEVAQRGDSLTVMARRATSRWLADNTVDAQITNEHRIYIEDYIKDHLTRHPVRIGQEETISFDLIKAAVESSKTLNEKQLKNLSKYTKVLNT